MYNVFTSRETQSIELRYIQEMTRIQFQLKKDGTELGVSQNGGTEETREF